MALLGVWDQTSSNRSYKARGLAFPGPWCSHKGLLTDHRSTGYPSERGFTLGDVHLMGVGKCIMRCTHHSRITRHSFCPKNPPCSTFTSCLPGRSEPLATADLFTVAIVFPLPECHIVGFDVSNNNFSKNPPVSKSFTKHLVFLFGNPASF